MAGKGLGRAGEAGGELLGPVLPVGDVARVRPERRAIGQARRFRVEQRAGAIEQAEVCAAEMALNLGHVLPVKASGSGGLAEFQGFAEPAGLPRGWMGGEELVLEFAATGEFGPGTRR